MNRCRPHPTVLAMAAVLATGCANEGRVVDLSPARETQLPVASDPLPAALEAGPHPQRPTGDEPPATVFLPGILVADRKAAIGSQLTGEVAAVLVREGDHVRVQQPVIRLDDRALRLEVSAAAAAMAAARRRLTSGVAGTYVTANEVDQLVTRAEGELQVALARRDAAHAALHSIQRESAAEIASARAQEEAASARLARLSHGSRPQELAVGRATVRAVAAQLARATDEAGRMRDLFQQGAAARQALVAATSEQERLEAELAQCQERLALLEEGNRPEEIREAEAQQRAAQAQLRVAESSQQRVEQLRAELSAAQAQVEHLQSALRVARDSRVRVDRSRLDADSLAGDVRLASANLELARERLRQAVLRSPIAGQVTRRQVEPGDSVTADQRILLEVVDPSSAHVEIAVSESELPPLRIGIPVWIELPSLPGKRIPGSLESLGAAPRGSAPGYVGRVRPSRLPRDARAGMLANVYLQPR